MASFLQKLFFGLALATFTLAQIDKTLEPGASGKDVVDAVLSKIRKSNIFSDDYEFLRRIAWVETHYGEANSTFSPGWYGGIWNVPQIFLNRTKDGALASYHIQIVNQLNVSWGRVTWNDLVIPLHSGIASRLYLAWLEINQNISIPEKTVDQAQVWDRHYNRRDEYNNHTFVNETEGMENVTVPCTGKMDFVMVMDASGSIGVENFELCKSFVTNLMTSFSLRGTRLGYIVYSYDVHRYFELDNYKSMEELVAIVNATPYDNENTNTNDALAAAIEMFEDAEPRFGVPKIMAVFTDGKSTSPDGVSNAALAEEAGIISYSVGITSGINLDELNEIAYNISNNVFLVNDFDTLNEFYRRLNQEACKVPQKPPLNEYASDTVIAGETRYFTYEMQPDGLTVTAGAIQGRVKGYYSYTEENPSSAVYDGQLKTNGVFVPPQQGTKNGRANTTVVYVAVTGIEALNEYLIKVKPGNFAGPDDTTTTELTTTSEIVTTEEWNSTDSTTESESSTTDGNGIVQATAALVAAAVALTYVSM